MTNLRSKLIRLAHTKPEFRPALLPLLREAAAPEEVAYIRGRYLPQDNPTLLKRKNTPQGLDIWTWEDGSTYRGIAFKGKQSKPLWNLRFRSIAEQEKTIQSAVDSATARIQSQQSLRDERKNNVHGLVEGDILWSSWGYEQTNINFYQVLSAVGKSIVVREISLNVIRSDGSGSDYVVPDVGSFKKGPPMKKIPQGSGKDARVKIETSYAYKWDGQPKRRTSPEWGY